MIEAGKSHKLTVPEDDFPRCGFAMTVIPDMGTPKMQMTIRSCVIGASPRPEIRGTGRRAATRKIFGENNTECLLSCEEFVQYLFQIGRHLGIQTFRHSFSETRHFGE